jgi:hypothetical protein
MRSIQSRRVVVMLSAGIEMATGVALIAAPSFVGHVLLGADLLNAGAAVARVAGLGLLSLGVACWPGGSDRTPQVERALFLYNLFTALYLGYLRIGAGFVSYLLWPACVVHALLAVLLAIQHRREIRSHHVGSTFSVT